MSSSGGWETVGGGQSNKATKAGKAKGGKDGKKQQQAKAVRPEDVCE